jgi:hypothetical protein
MTSKSPIQNSTFAICNPRLDKLSVASHLNAQQIVVYKKILNLAKSAKSYEHYLELLGDSADFFPSCAS